MSASIGLPPISTEIIVKSDKVATGMQKAGSVIDEEAKKITGKLDRVGQVGKGLSSVGGAMTKFVSLPLAGIGIAAGKMAIDFESSFAKVSTLLDKNQVDYNKYKKDILKASSDANIAVGEFSEAVYGSISAGVEQTKAIDFTTKAMKLAKGGFTSGAKAVDILTTALNGYKLKAEDTTKISDLLITTQNLGKTTVDELASSMGKVIPIASSANFNITELSTSYAVLTKNGIATAEAGTYLKAMLSEITKAGSDSDKALRKLTKKGFAELKAEGKSTSEILNMLSQYAQKNGKTLKDMFGSVEAGSAALVLANQEGKEYNEILAEMEKSAGATQQAFDKIDATPAERWARALNRFKNKSIELGSKMLPVFEKIMGKVEKVIDWFSSLDDSTQKLYLKWGAGLIAAGPLIKGLGGILTTASKVPKVFKLISSSMGLLSTGAKVTAPAITGTATATATATASASGLAASLGSVAMAAGPYALAAVAVAAGGYAIYKGFEEKATPAANHFADVVKTTSPEIESANGQIIQSAEKTTLKISEETKKKAEAFFELSDKAKLATTELYAGIIPMTDEGVNQVTTLTTQMSDKVIQDINTQKDETIAKYQEIFSMSTTLTAEQKQQILNDTNSLATERVNKVTELKDELIKLYEEIKKKGIKNASEEKKRIEEIYEELAKEEIRSVTKSKNEQEALLENLSKNKSKITSKTIEDTIQKFNEERDKGIKAAEDEYKTRMDAAIQYKTDIEASGRELSAEQKRNYDTMVQDADYYKAQMIEQCDNIRNRGLKKLYEAFPELTSQINLETGKQLGFFSKLRGGAKKTAEEINNIHYEDKTYTITRREVTQQIYESIYRGKSDHNRSFGHSNHANGLDYVPYDGYHARLHRGERVLTEKENKQYSSSGNGNINIKIEKVENNTKEDVRNLVRRLGDEIKRQNFGRGQLA
ncbi:phage tail tape measure protein [uncultured Parvimonas sp.]|uniref:phage tail tape measure protein n=1 Tax=uncultured Parvimonas sp. TaxID=747372 RepID=UPI002599F808|nr:phage tail tape measure protein [uncultured Parvimonas sp.]